MNPAMALKLLGALKKAKGAGRLALPALGRGRAQIIKEMAREGITAPAESGAMVLGRKGLLGALEPGASKVGGAARGAAATSGRLMRSAGGAMGRAGDAMQVPTWMKAMGAAGGGLGLYEMGTWAADALTGDGEVSQKKLRMLLMDKAIQEAKHKETLAPYQRAIEDNKRSMASMDPTLMNSILAGQQLMDGEEVLGGNPRTDILDRIALRMAMGDFQDQEMF